MAQFGPPLLKILLASAAISLAIAALGQWIDTPAPSTAIALALVLGPPAIVAMVLIQRDRAHRAPGQPPTRQP
ncbi:MAG: hypothetical protein MH825_11415 [Cyanobacteria bacterium]|nr:hypothetical protein [Cyanobacteriota bacterium]